MSYIMTTSFRLSMGTGLAFETFFKPTASRIDEFRVVPSPIQSLQTYDHVYINLITLARNVVEAVDTEMFDRLTFKNYLTALTDDIDTILELFKSHKLSKPIFIKNMYGVIAKDGYGYRYRESKPGTKARKKDELTIKLTGHVLSMIRDNKIKVRLQETVTGNSSIVLTHIPLDVILASNPKRLHVLESHTGIVKTIKMMYTKYPPVGKLKIPPIPFNKMLYYIFGDKVVIKPMSTAIRKTVLNEIKLARITSMSSDNAVRVMLKSIPNTSIQSVLYNT